ncbi:MAG TPA: TIGR02391 family protein [Candidatus Limnocylindria bacterium]|nr:TIGR02391 family protein [Candidatus Limnocylindria bacterium]
MIKEFRNARELDAATTTLRRRIADVQELTGKNHDDPSVDVLEERIGKTICEIFGPDSPECRDHQYHAIPYGAQFIRDPFHDYEEHDQAAFETGIPRTVAMLEGLISHLEEKRELLGPTMPDPAAGAEAIHPRLANVARELYRDRHYAQAVAEAAKALVNMVKERSRVDDADGTALMTRVFSVNSPVLAFNDLKDQTDRDEQQGMMHLYAGAVLAIRNPRSHDNVLDSRESAGEMLGLLSFLARRLDDTRRP